MRVITRPVLGGWRLAAPSLVLPDALDVNCRALAGRVDDICLTLYETRSCLAYTETELATDLATLPGRAGRPLGFHAHLPLDLPWEAGAAVVVEAVADLAKKCAYLGPEFFVLHPPDAAAQFEDFLAVWRGRGFDPGMLLVENIESNDLADILALADAAGCGLCFDVGHAQAFDQERLLDRPETLRMLRCLHVYSPHDGPKRPFREQGGHGHYSLSRLDAAGRALLRRALDLAAAARDARGEPDFSVLIEVFEWRALCESSAILAELAPGIEPVTNPDAGAGGARP